MLMPYTTVQKRLQGSTFDNVNAIMVSARTEALMPRPRARSARCCCERHRIPPGEPPDFEVQNTTEIANILRHHHRHDDADAVGDRRHLAAWSAAWAS